MQITALIQTINYLKEISRDPSLLDKYRRLHELTKSALENPEHNIVGEILKEKEQLRLFLLETDPVNWGYASYSIFEKVNKNCLFGKPAADYLDKFITIDTKDYHFVSNELSKKIKHITKLSDNLNKFQQLFELIFPSEISGFDKEEDDRSSLLLYFEDRLSIQNISDLERYSRLWDGIIGTFSRLTGEERLALDIKNFNNNDFVLGVFTKDETLNAISDGLTGLLSSLNFVLKIRKIQVEMVSLSLQNDLTDLLEYELQTHINHTALSTAQDLVSKYLNQDIDRDVMINDISRSLKQVMSFIEKGGKIECKPHITSIESNQTNRIINESFLIVREIENLKNILVNRTAKEETIISEFSTFESIALNA